MRLFKGLKPLKFCNRQPLQSRRISQRPARGEVGCVRYAVDDLFAGCSPPSSSRGHEESATLLDDQTSGTKRKKGADGDWAEQRFCMLPRASEAARGAGICCQEHEACSCKHAFCNQRCPSIDSSILVLARSFRNLGKPRSDRHPQRSLGCSLSLGKIFAA